MSSSETNSAKKAVDQLYPLVYKDLRDLAKNYLRKENPNHTLQVTALVNEAYIRSTQLNKESWESTPTLWLLVPGL